MFNTQSAPDSLKPTSERQRTIDKRRKKESPTSKVKEKGTQKKNRGSRTAPSAPRKKYNSLSARPEGKNGTASIKVQPGAEGEIH